MKLVPGTRTQQLGVAIGTLVFAKATWSLVIAILEATASGTVNVVDYDEVPWPHAWAYFLGVLLLVAAGVSLVAAALVDSIFVLLALALSSAGALLSLFSGPLSSVVGAVTLSGFVAVLVITFLLKKHLGKLEAGVFWTVAILGYFVVMSLRG